MPGGQMLDFVLQGPGLVYVIYVNGDYWHKFGLKLDITRQNEQVVSRVMPGAVVVSVFSNDLATDAIARVTLLKMVGRG
jgi:hypothetical protein